MKVLICGSRGWLQAGVIRDRIAELPAESEVIEGGAHGVDTLARKCALDRGLEVVEYPASWRRDGSGGGPKRNIRMLEREQPTLVIAFHLANSSGTAHMIREARKRGIEVEVIEG